MHKIAGVRSVGRTASVAHLLAVAVVGSNQRFAVEFKKFRNDAGTTCVHCLYRFDAGLDHPGVTDHVGIGEV